MRIAAVLLVLSATAHAAPGAVEMDVDASAGLPFGNSHASTPMDYTVSGNAVIGLGGGYRFTPRTAAGIYVEYGLADASDDHGTARMLRVGAYGRHLFEDFSLSVRAGYEQLDVSYVFPSVTNDDTWRGIELLRPELGMTAYQRADCTVDLYAAVSLGMFEYEARNGHGGWLSDRVGDMPDGPALHGWLMLGTRVVFDAF